MASFDLKMQTLSDDDVKANEVVAAADEVEDSSDPSATAAERRLVRKIDIRVLPLLCILYALSLIDRSSISAAKIAGMKEDLDLTGNRFNVALLVFFAPYMLSEIPSNAILRRIGTQKYLAFLVVAWGVVAMCFGFVQNYEQLLVLRVLLGLFEGGFAPGCIYLISSWYKRYETQTRLAIWYVSGTLISGFQGIIAYGLNQMDGVGGLAGWRWIYIIPGVLTVVMALPVLIWIADFPERARWLSPEELELVRSRLAADREEALEDKTTPRDVFRSLRDWKVWVLACMLCWPNAGAYTMSFFTPSILAGFGYSVALSQILVTPPYILAAICSVITGMVADRLHRRTPFMIGYGILVIAGFVMIGWGKNTATRLIGVFLSIVGNNCVIPSVFTFLVNNIASSQKRHTAIALHTMWGGVGGIIGSLVFREEDYPTYRPGLYASFANITIFLLITALMAGYFSRLNQAADKKGRVLEGLPGFRYTL